MPAALTRAPATGAINYNIAVATPNAATYTVTSTPAGVMAGDVCGNLVIDNTGARTFSGGGGTQDVCWAR